MFGLSTVLLSFFLHFSDYFSYLCINWLIQCTLHLSNNMQPTFFVNLIHLNISKTTMMQLSKYFFFLDSGSHQPFGAVSPATPTQYQFNISLFHNMYCLGLKMNELIFYWIVISSIFRTCLSSGPTTERLKMKFSLTHSSTRSQRRRNGTAPTVMWRTV